jgi:excinuclease ABC subunit A
MKKSPRYAEDVIEVVGAAEHNLKNVSLKIPKHKLVVFTGVSGSGKSSLAFDTLYAEGQRRYVESLSAYARQFLGQMEKPKYEKIRGLSPTIAIEQKAASNNPRSTVGTVTEVYDYLRVFYARFGTQHCPKCGRVATGSSPEQILATIAKNEEGSRIDVLAPVVKNRKGEFRDVLQALKEKGFLRLRVDGRVVRLDQEEITLDKKSKHDIAILVDRIVWRNSERDRLADSVETALREGEGELVVVVGESGKEELMSVHRACSSCGVSFAPLSPQSFSFNSPLGACPACKGLGTKPEMDVDLIVPDGNKSLDEGAVTPWASALSRAEGWKADTVMHVLHILGVPSNVPWNEIPQAKRDALMLGATVKGHVWEGLIPQLMRRYLATQSDGQKEFYLRFLSDKECTSCEGTRLLPESRAVQLGGLPLPKIACMTIREAQVALSSLSLSAELMVASEELRKEIQSRLGFLLDVGLEYLTLGRGSSTLSGGESQRIRLASQIGSELTGVLYVLDEPSIGLHQRDNERLLSALLRLRDLGNSVIVVEHDEDTVRAADWVCDFGPLAGSQGGELVASGPLATVLKEERSLTAAFLSGRRMIATPSSRRMAKEGVLEVIGAESHNLKRVDAAFPIGLFTAVTGVSGAGKSTLVNRILLPALMRKLHDSRELPGKHEAIYNAEAFDKVIAIDQQPIGRTPRSNPATYTKCFDAIRQVFAGTKEARAFGYDPGRFSFNVPGGRCEACSGDGVRRVEMHFLPDVYVTCEVCKGRRFNDQTLRVQFKGKSIADVLDMTIAEAHEHFAVHRDIARILQTLLDVGLGYLKVGQPSPTLSGGEAQRIKLARELSRVSTKGTLYILDEPTTGLHFADIEKLLAILHRLADQGSTLIVIEHNLDVIRSADWVIDLGPDGGDQGGRIVAAGTPEDVAEVAESVTGRFLREALKQRGSTKGVGGKAAKANAQNRVEAKVVEARVEAKPSVKKGAKRAIVATSSTGPSVK